MRIFTTVMAALILLVAGMAQGQETPANRPDAAGVQQAVAGYAKAVNDRNVAGVVAFFTDDAALFDVDGNVTRGKAAIGEQFAGGFSEPSAYRLESTADSIRFLTDNVAQIEGTSKLSAPNEPSIINRFTALVVRKDNSWRVAEVRDLPPQADDVPPYDRLKELEWMVGDWVDESGDATVNSSIRWGDNNAYLVRNSNSQVGKEKGSSSLMILAWDPRTEQLRSWLFNSEGGMGEAVWTRSAEDQWVIKASGTLRDGSPTSATQIMTLNGKDSVTTSSLDRIIGGEVAPDIEEIVTVRKPPAPGGTTTGGTQPGR